jgi:hypothetical protein
LVFDENWEASWKILMMHTDLGVLSGIRDNCEQAGDGDLLSDYTGEEPEFNAEDGWDCDTICHLRSAGWEDFSGTEHSKGF